jgi:adenosylcobinamide-GDP ribazoletransferase
MSSIRKTSSSTGPSLMNSTVISTGRLRVVPSSVRTCTTLPFPGRDAGDKTRALPFFCIAGLIVAGTHLIVAWLLEFAPYRLSSLLGPALCAVNLGVTGALHLDGLADTADALGMVRSRERTLAILKDPHMGTFGTAAVVLALIWRSVVYAGLAEVGALSWLFPCMVGSRAMQGIVLSFLPYARPEGGMGSPFAGNRAVGWVCVVEFVLCAALCGWTLGVPAALVATLVATLGAALICGACGRRIGGITGDGVGAATEVYELAFLTVAIGSV